MVQNEQHPWHSQERRATDGLDWQASGPLPVKNPEPAPPDSPGLAFQPVEPPPVPAMAAKKAAVGPGWWTAAGIAAVSAILGGLVSGGVVALATRSDAPATSGIPAGTTSTKNISIEQTSAIADVASRMRDGVVRIESTRRTNAGIEHDVGSGIVIDMAGHIVTNAHVVEQTESLKVIFSDGTEKAAILLGDDYPYTDVAVIQVSPGGLKPLMPGDSSKLKLGETVIAIGNPLAEFDGSVTVGVVSGLNRQRTLDDVRQDGLIQTDAAVNSGNSGGALLNLEGQFVGMPTAILRESSTGVAVEGIAFALPTARFLPIAQRIIETGASYPRPSIGAATRDLTPELAQRLPRVTVGDGAIIMSVDTAGPMARAGAQTGDVITMFAGQPVNRSTPFLNVLMQHEPDEAVKVVLNRNGRIIETDVRLAKRG